MSISKRIMGVVFGGCVALLIAVGATSSPGSAAIPSDQPAPMLIPTDSDDALAACGKCGDGYCNPRCGETSTSCPLDCGGGSTSVAAACGKCGDNYCNPRCGETATSCPLDCGAATASKSEDCSP